MADDRLGAMLRADMEALGWTVPELRKRLALAGLDVTDRAIDSWLRGERVPTALGVVLDVLGIRGARRLEMWDASTPAPKVAESGR